MMQEWYLLSLRFDPQEEREVHSQEECEEKKKLGFILKSENREKNYFLLTRAPKIEAVLYSNGFQAKFFDVTDQVMNWYGEKELSEQLMDKMTLDAQTRRIKFMVENNQVIIR